MDGEDAVTASPEQMGFGFDDMLREQETAHIPATMDEAIPFYRKLIDRHHEAMLSGDIEKTTAIREEAQELAVKLNGGTLLGICGGPDAPARILERETAAPPGTIPMWGQEGSFTVDVNGMKARIEQDGMFGAGSGSMFWPGFAAHAVDYDKPFLSETGYRSFHGAQGSVAPGITPDKYAEEMIRSYMQRECKGKPRKIEGGYVEREMARRAARANPRQREPHS
jgi:hypothetical protein